MGRTEQTPGRTEAKALSSVGSALELCRLARELEDRGDYEAASSLLSPFWTGVGGRPETATLDEHASAEVLLRAGVLTGWIGSSDQAVGSQEAAKNLISESLAIFERLRLVEKVAEAQVELAYCYWREGAFDEARVLLQEALDRLGDRAGEVRAIALLRKAIVESSATRFSDSLRILLDSAPIFESSANHTLRGRFHNELAYNLQRLASAENRTDYTDRALVEFTAASFHFEQAGHAKYHANVENNLGLLFFELGKFGEAQDHLNRARKLSAQLKDRVSVAQVDETRARVFLALGQAAEAARTVGTAIRGFEKAGEEALLAEALTTHGEALARLGRLAEARQAFERAAATAEQAGSIERAGIALLTLIETLGWLLDAEELRVTYKRADEMLVRSQQPEIFARLLRAVRQVLDAPLPIDATPANVSPSRLSHVAPADQEPMLVESLITESLQQHRKQVEFTPEAIHNMRHFFFKENAQTLRSLIRDTVAAAPPGSIVTADAVEIVALRQRTPQGNFAHPWADFSLKDELGLAEKRFIELALKDADGKISVAARLLGFTHTELLTSIIKSRHSELLAARTAPIPRKRSIISKVQRRPRR